MQRAEVTIIVKQYAGSLSLKWVLLQLNFDLQKMSSYNYTKVPTMNLNEQKKKETNCRGLSSLLSCPLSPSVLFQLRRGEEAEKLNKNWIKKLKCY